MAYINGKLGLLLAAGLLAGCAGPKTLYSWDQYQPTVYQYYQQDKTSPEGQIASLQQAVEQARAKGQAVPPGLNAHMGLLYAKTGRDTEAFQYFEAERNQFPESAPYMDFLLSKNKGNIK